MSIDFKVVSFGRVGTMAVNQFLMAHEEIGIHHFDKVVKAFLKPVDGKVQLDFADDPLIASRGVTFHDQILFKTTSARALQLTVDVRTPKLIHSVRHPVDSLISWINYTNSRAILDSTEGWKPTGSNIRKYLEENPEYSSTIKFGYQAELFYPNAEDIFLLDFEQLSADKIHETMNGVYAFLGVSPFTSPVFAEPQNNLSLQLHHKGFTVNVNGEAVRFSLKAAASVRIANERNESPVPVIGTFLASGMAGIYQKCPSVERVNDDLCVVIADAETYNNLKDGTKDIINTQAGAIVQQALPQWAVWAEGVINQIQKVKISKLSDDDYAFVREFLKEDLEVFAGYHPEYKSKWDL